MVTLKRRASNLFPYGHLYSFIHSVDCTAQFWCPTTEVYTFIYYFGIDSNDPHVDHSDPHVAHKDLHVDHSDPNMDQYDPHMDQYDPHVDQYDPHTAQNWTKSTIKK